MSLARYLIILSLFNVVITLTNASDVETTPETQSWSAVSTMTATTRHSTKAPSSRRHQSRRQPQIPPYHICALCKCSSAQVECYSENLEENFLKNWTNVVLNSTSFDNFGDDPGPALTGNDVYSQNRITHIRIDFELPMQLKVHHNTFANMKNLDILYLYNVDSLKLMPNLDGIDLSELTIQKSGLSTIKTEFCTSKANLQSIDLADNELADLKFVFDNCKSLIMMDLSFNRLDSIKDMFTTELPQLRNLNIDSNKITSINEYDLKHLSGLESLSLANNRIEYIHERAFDWHKRLQKLDLSVNRLHSLPSHSVAYMTLKVLNVNENPSLLDFPESSLFISLNQLQVHYSYHCCPFIKKDAEKEAKRFKDFILSELRSEGKMDFGDDEPASAFNDDLILDHNPSDEFNSIIQSGQTIIATQLDSEHEDYPIDPEVIDDEVLARELSMHQFLNKINCKDTALIGRNSTLKRACRYKEFKESVRFKCMPEPDPFTPCSNLLEYWWLRISVWLVSTMGILSNLCVVIYNLIHSVLYYNNNNAVSVPTFLLTNLATADSLMSVYLLLIAVKDTTSRQHFGQSALLWQRSFTCNLAGFLSVVSSVSSALCLAFITFERYYAIKNSINLNKRVTPKLAFILTTLIWLVSVIAACLPLFELNDYSAYAICLPFDTRTKVFQIYLIGLNGLLVLCFFFICICYGMIFVNTLLAERRASMTTCNNDAQLKLRNTEDKKLARNISLLVLANIICWGPVVFLCVQALLTNSEMNKAHLKILAIFVIPFNSVINPFLYCLSRRSFLMYLRANFIKSKFRRNFGTSFSTTSARSTTYM